MELQGLGISTSSECRQSQSPCQGAGEATGSRQSFILRFEHLKTIRKRRTFWPRSFPRKPTSRLQDIERPSRANSFGNKKAKFSNERTMVHWIKSSLLLGSLAITLLSFGVNAVTPYIGVALLVICLTTMVYANTVFQVRMEWLNMCRDDVHYYDRVAPTLITLFLMATLGFNAIVIYTGDFHTNKMFFKSSLG